MEWFRWYHGTSSDPKFAIVAKRSGQPRHVVLACWAMIIEHASSRTERGSVCDIDLEEVSVTLDLEIEQAQAVFDAMCDKGLICDNQLKNWSKRQPKREDATGAERKERWKERQRTGTQENASERTGTQENASERTGTQENASERLERARTEQNREENKEPPISPTGDGVGAKTTRSRTPRNEKPIVYSLTFETAWAAYPRKVEKGAAWAAWEKAAKRGMQESTMPGIIRARSAALDWAKDSGRYVPHMATWLNKNGWEDEISTESHGHDQFAGVL